MRAYFATVFDDIVQNTTVVYSDEAQGALLGSATETSFQIVANVFDGGPRLYVAIEHSADGRNWADLPDVSLIVQDLSWTDTNNYIGSYNARKAARLVRFKIYLSGAASVRVKIFACGRSRAPRPAELPVAYEMDSPDDFWPLEGGDDALLDQESLLQLRSLEETCGRTDPMVVYLARELRRAAWARRFGTPRGEEGEPSGKESVEPLSERACPCPCVSQPRPAES